MKIKVLARFRDKNDYQVLYEVGEILDFNETRATDLVARGLAEVFETPTPKESVTTEEPKVEVPETDPTPEPTIEPTPEPIVEVAQEETEEVENAEEVTEQPKKRGRKPKVAND